jgi:ATP-dependent helicase/nuclease subunit A
MRGRGFEEILKDYGIRQEDKHPLYLLGIPITIKQYSYEEAAEAEYMEQLFSKVNREDFTYWDKDRIYDEAAREGIRSYMEYKYPYETETNIHTKLTVSELKRLGQYEAEDFGTVMKSADKKGKEIIIPEFAGESDIATGADLGTLYHTVLEAMDLLQIHTEEDIYRTLLALRKKEKITETDIHVLDIDRLFRFTKSGTAERMKKAAREGMLFKERRFIMGMKANEINDSLKSEETVLIQGVIDVYFEEEGQWVLLDYKTDAVSGERGEEQLSRRYKVQLDYYQKALEQLTGKVVKERIIYSFGLNKEIRI